MIDRSELQRAATLLNEAANTSDERQARQLVGWAQGILLMGPVSSPTRPTPEEVLKAAVDAARYFDGDKTACEVDAYVRRTLVI